MYVEFRPQIFGAHGRAFEVPAGKTFAPGRAPAHDVFGRCLHPDGEVGGVPFFALVFEVVARFGHEFLHVAPGKAAVNACFFNKFERIEIHGTIGFVAVPVFEYVLHHFYLFRYVAGSARLDAGRQGVENAHHFVETHGVFLSHFHGFQLLQTGALEHTVFAVVQQVAYIGDVANVAHAIADVLQVAVNDIETDKSAAVAEVNVVINRRAAHIHAYMSVLHGLESLFLSCDAVVQLQVVFHCCREIIRPQAANCKPQATRVVIRLQKYGIRAIRARRSKQNFG